MEKDKLRFWEEYDERNKPIKTCVRYLDPLSKKKRRKTINWKKYRIKNSRQARRILTDKVEEEIENSPIVLKETTKTFGSLVDKFVAEWENVVKPSSFRQRKYLLNIIYRKIPRETSLDVINASFIKSVWRKELLSENNVRTGKPLSSSTLASMRSFLKQVLYFGYENNLFSSSTVYTVRLDIPKKRKAEKEKIRQLRFMEREEVKIFFDCLYEYCQKNHLDGLSKRYPDFRYYDYCLFLLKTGARPGEVSSLIPEKFNFVEKSFKIDEQMITAGLSRKNTYLDEPKTEESNRVVPVDDETIEIVQRRIRDNEKRRLSITNWQEGFYPWKRRKEVPSYIETEYIFQTIYGTAITSHNLNEFLNGNGRVHGGVMDFIRKRHPEWKKHITAYSFRYTHISLLAEANVPIKAVMNRVGHKHAATTLEIYNQATKLSKQKVIDEINNWDFSSVI